MQSRIVDEANSGVHPYFREASKNVGLCGSQPSENHITG